MTPSAWVSLSVTALVLIYQALAWRDRLVTLGKRVIWEGTADDE